MIESNVLFQFYNEHTQNKNNNPEYKKQYFENFHKIHKPFKILLIFMNTIGYLYAHHLGINYGLSESKLFSIFALIVHNIICYISYDHMSVICALTPIISGSIFIYNEHHNISADKSISVILWLCSILLAENNILKMLQRSMLCQFLTIIVLSVSIMPSYTIMALFWLMSILVNYAVLYLHHTHIKDFKLQFDRKVVEKQLAEKFAKEHTEVEREKALNERTRRDKSRYAHVTGGNLARLEYAQTELAEKLTKHNVDQETKTLVQSMQETTNSLILLNRVGADTVNPDDIKPVIDRCFWKSFECLDGYPKVIINYPDHDIILPGNAYAKADFTWLVMNLKDNARHTGCGEVIITVDISEQIYISPDGKEYNLFNSRTSERIAGSYKTMRIEVLNKLPPNNSLNPQEIMNPTMRMGSTGGSGQGAGDVKASITALQNSVSNDSKLKPMRLCECSAESCKCRNQELLRMCTYNVSKNELTGVVKFAITVPVKDKPKYDTDEETIYFGPLYSEKRPEPIVPNRSFIGKRKEYEQKKEPEPTKYQRLDEDHQNDHQNNQTNPNTQKRKATELVEEIPLDNEGKKRIHTGTYETTAIQPPGTDIEQQLMQPNQETSTEIQKVTIVTIDNELQHATILHMRACKYAEQNPQKFNKPVKFTDWTEGFDFIDERIKISYIILLLDEDLGIGEKGHVLYTKKYKNNPRILGLSCSATHLSKEELMGSGMIQAGKPLPRDFFEELNKKIM